MRPATILAFVVSFSILTGCPRSSTNPKMHSEAEHGEHEHGEHEHGDDKHLQSFAEAVDQIGIKRTTIIEAFQNGKPAEAHDDLHEIGDLLTALPVLANEAEYSEDDQRRFRSISNAMLDAFGKLDGVLHGGDPPDLASVSAQIDTLVESLAKHPQR